MARFYVMCGPSGAGKSTIARNILNDDYDHSIIVSTDQIREDYFGDATDQTHNCEVFQIAREMVHTSFGWGFENVIFDATNLTRAARRRILHWVKDYDCEKIAVMVYPPLEVCLERNQQRERHVLEDVIRRQHAKYEPYDRKEGFDDGWIYLSKRI